MIAKHDAELPRAAEGLSRRRRDVPLAWLLALLVLAAVAPLATLCTYTALRWDVAERMEEINRVGDVARTLAQAIDRELRAHRDAAEMLASSRVLAMGDLAAFEDQARAIAGRGGGDVVLFDAASRKLFDTREQPGTSPAPAVTSEAVKRGIATGMAEIDNLGPVAGVRPMSFGVHVPVVGPDRAVRYVLTLVPPADVILNVVRQTYRPDGWFAAVIDGNGRIVAQASQHEAFFGRIVPDSLINRLTGGQRVLETVDLEGRPSVTAFHRSGLSGWHAIVWVPKAVIEVPSRARRDAVLSMLGLTTLLSIAVSVAAARLINRSTRRTMKAARALAVGAPVAPESSLIREDNVVRTALADAARIIAAREESLRENARRMKFVMRELSHRSKNLLTVVQSMARQTGRYTHDTADFRARFDDRISSLARSHDLLVKHDWRGATLADLIDRQLTPFVEAATDRISAEGPNLMLRPDATQTIGMALHELATNASKHGALSTPGGRIRICWDVVGEGGSRRMRLVWQESGGPPVHPPTHHGFGHVVVERMVSMALQGRAKLDWLPEGVRWVLEAPLAAITDQQPAADKLTPPGGADR